MRPSPRRFLAFATLACLLATTACSGDADVLLAVDLRTDIVPVDEFAYVRVSFADASGAVRTMVRDPASRGSDYIAGHRIAEVLVTPGSLRLLVELVSEDERVVASRPVAVTVDRALGVTVVITRDCVGVVCPGSGDPTALSACLGGRCVSPECTEETPAACGAAECTVDGDCPAGAACATPRCASGVCLLEADDTMCGAAERCVPETGCATRTSTGGMDPDPTMVCPNNDSAFDAGSFLNQTLRPAGGNGFAGTCGGSDSDEIRQAFDIGVGGTFVFTTVGAPVDTVLHLRDGSCTGPELGCNDDAEPGVTWSTLRVPVADGQRVILFVDGKTATDSGPVTVLIYEESDSEIGFCNDTIDNDGNGLADCLDPDCMAMDPRC